MSVGGQREAVSEQEGFPAGSCQDCGTAARLHGGAERVLLPSLPNEQGDSSLQPGAGSNAGGGVGRDVREA